jgi:hypothetical protein
VWLAGGAAPAASSVEFHRLTYRHFRIARQSTPLLFNRLFGWYELLIVVHTTPREVTEPLKKLLNAWTRATDGW